MDVNDIKNVQQLRTSLEESKVDVKIGFFGGRKFSIGNDPSHRYSLDQLIAKAYQLAAATDTPAPSYELASLENDLKNLNQKGEDALNAKGTFKKSMMFARRLFRQKQVTNRFESLDCIREHIKEDEGVFLKKNKADFLLVLKGEKKIEELNVPIWFSASLRQANPTNSIPENPTDEQLLDIWECIIMGKKLNFLEQITEFETLLETIKEKSKIDITKVFDPNELTISGLSRVNDNLKLLDLNNLSPDTIKDKTLIQTFIEDLLKNPPEENATIIKEWIGLRGQLVLPPRLDGT